MAHARIDMLSAGISYKKIVRARNDGSRFIIKKKELRFNAACAHFA
jgi:hypothetical protein